MLAKLLEILARDVRLIQALDDLRSSDGARSVKQSQARNEAELLTGLGALAKSGPSSLCCDLSVHFTSAPILVQRVGNPPKLTHIKGVPFYIPTSKANESGGFRWGVGWISAT